jgi:hypothetical protein
MICKQNAKTKENYQHYLQSNLEILKLFDRLNLTYPNYELADCYNDISIGFHMTSNTRKETLYALKSLEVFRKLNYNDHEKFAFCLYNCSNSFKYNEDYKKELMYLQQAYEMYERLETGDDEDFADCIESLADSYLLNGNEDLYLHYKFMSQEMLKRLDLIP